MKKIKKSRRSVGKKAVVEVQFNWIFVLIAGAMILAFFIMIISKQKTVSDKKLATEILNSMDRIMSGQKASENRQDIINMFEAEMFYSCGGCDCTFSLAGMSKSKGNIIVFAPDRMKSDRLLTWTQNWDMPFRVTNFVYLTVPEIKYYFVTSDQNIIKNFIGELPMNISAYVVADAEEIAYRGEEKIRIIFFSDPPVMPSGLADVDNTIVTAVTIDDTTGSWYNGQATLRFYKKGPTGFEPDTDEEGLTNEYPVLGMGAAYGAVYSDSFQNFKCNMDDAIARMKYVAEVYRKRSVNLETAVLDSSLEYCNYLYASDYFSGFDIKQDNIDTNQLYGSINTLISYNDGAIGMSCPRIY